MLSFRANPELLKSSGFFVVNHLISQENTLMLDAKLVTKSHPEHQTIVELSKTVSVGGTELLIVGGPCTVES
ncbi:MAG: hypothetical protein ACMG55_18070, partial [Microcoleus sp.]